MYNSSLNTYNTEISGSPKSHARPLRPLLGKSQQNGPDVRLGESRPRAIMKLKARWIARIQQRASVT
ncbi:hypothetical protein HBI75_214520 [Parastagonospora nodorum]|nr:hypothetical protein HBI75_214520 [Parastagonospora nodorum]